MERQQLICNRTLGLYIPSAFKIVIESNMSFNKFSDKDWTTFAHEYVHLLQDLTTVYGAYNIFYMSEYLKAAHSSQKNAVDHILKIPYTPENEGNGNVFRNMALSEYTLGSYEDIEYIKRIIAFNPDTNDIDSKDIGEIEDAKFIVELRDGKKEEIHFGAYAVKESMAYLFERFVSAASLSTPPDFPYSFAEMIVDFIYPDFGKDKLNILALCDIALQSSNPGPAFVYNLNKMRQTNYFPKKPEELYDNAYKQQVIIYGYEEGLHSFMDSIIIFLQQGKLSLEDYFHDDIFKQCKDWLTYVFDKAIWLRENSPYFIIDAARAGNIKNNSIIKELMENYFGTPLVVNGFGQLSSRIPGQKVEGELLFFPAIIEIALMMLTGKTSCGLKSVCALLKDVDVSIDCDTEPWKRLDNGLRDRCPYITMWRHWNFTGCIPIRKK